MLTDEKFIQRLAKQKGDLLEHVAALQDGAATMREAINQQARNLIELEDALSECVLQIEYLHGKFGETGSGNAVLARAKALIP